MVFTGVVAIVIKKCQIGTWDISKFRRWEINNLPLRK
jgi:hypothetical protein